MLNNKIASIEVTQDFINQREQRAKIYNPGQRSETQLRLDIECEIFEWDMISKGIWDDDDRWQVDGVCSIYGNVDVKFIKKWYNIPCQKLIYILRQRDITETFFFCEWNYRPERLLEDGDQVKVNMLGALPYWDLLDNIKTSKYNGYYVDVKKLISK